jgi:hypothetical protein
LVATFTFGMEAAVGDRWRDAAYFGSHAWHGQCMLEPGTGRRCVIVRTRHWVWITPVFLAVALSGGAADAADKGKVDGATKRVEKGAKQIGQGQVGPGFKEMFTGVGHTIVEGAKFSGENIKEFFAGKK